MTAERSREVDASTWFEDETGADRRRLSLLVLGEGTTSRIPLPDAGAVTIGRSADADVTLDERAISRLHVRLRIGEGLSVEDLGSRNGTRLRGAALGPSAPAALAVGEAFQLGKITCLIQEEHLDSTAPAGAKGAALSLEALLPRIARSRINVLLLGETGVGKEVTARRIHELSPRSARPFVAVNCGALAESLVESEFFGHEKGSFTGAAQPRVGFVEASSGGTLFLDEVGDMPLAIQVKLLRVLDLKEVTRVGSHTPRSVDLRVVSATHRDLRAEVAAGRFREDLFFRLCGVPVVIPPLRERRDELPELLDLFLGECAAANGLPSLEVSADARAWLDTYDYPGNIRELRNLLQRGALLAANGRIELADLQYSPEYRAKTAPVAPSPRRDTGGGESPERQEILDALARCGGNQTRAARLLGISRRTLGKRLDRYSIPRPQKG